MTTTPIAAIDLRIKLDDKPIYVEFENRYSEANGPADTIERLQKVTHRRTTESAKKGAKVSKGSEAAHDESTSHETGHLHDEPAHVLAVGQNPSYQFE